MVKTCGKTRYPSRGKARAAIAAIRTHAARAVKKPCRAYLCEHCHGWHLTSAPQ